MNNADHSTEQREWDELRAYGQTRFRGRLQSEGFEPDHMTEEEKMDYVDRAIHEQRPDKDSLRSA